MSPEYLYLHVPFCVRRCSYCDFAVDVVRRAPVDAWLDAISAELALLAETESWEWPLRLRTVSVGGGTPSLLGAGAMEALRRRLEPYVRLSEDVEWSVEANPESFDEAVARGWREAGVNRLSLGAQTFHEGALRWMGRLHGPEGAVRAVEAARRAGIEHVSIDLIFGLPARLGRAWGTDLSRVLELDLPHISLYGLTAEPATPLGRWVGEGREVLADEGAYAAEYLLAAERLAAAGYVHYEVSNFARPGRESRHNSAYWTGEAYLGLGPSAHSYLPPERRWNLRGWAAYRSALAEGRSPVDSRETVEGAAVELERTWLALRTRAGLARVGWTAAQESLVESWVDRGWAEYTAGGVRLTP